MNNRIEFKRYLSEGEERQLFSTIKKQACIYAQRDYWWMVLARSTGVRVCVLSGLTLGDATLALEEDKLKVRGAINKRGREHDVYLVKKSRAALRELIRIHRKLAAGIDWELDTYERPLILSRNGKGMSIRSFQDRMKKWREEAGIDAECSPHWWRHTFAKRALKNSTAVDAQRRVQLALAHQDIRSTDIYTMPDKEDMRELMRDANQ